MANCTLRADAVSVPLSDAVCACGVYVGLSVCGVCVCVCLECCSEMMDGGEGWIHLWCISDERENVYHVVPISVTDTL